MQNNNPFNHHFGSKPNFSQQSAYDDSYDDSYDEPQSMVRRYEPEYVSRQTDSRAIHDISDSDSDEDGISVNDPEEYGQDNDTVEDLTEDEQSDDEEQEDQHYSQKTQLYSKNTPSSMRQHEDVLSDDDEIEYQIQQRNQNITQQQLMNRHLNRGNMKSLKY